ncbi:hypothetical protein AAJ76_320002978 [Vairimorpha ceranae]|uniref:Uncharacterized protein n=1 Tax=Vairimorpha ceranae TaxID=40302 RepID=A0A0F9WC50_9MICR|nr:hypothetical protein AAJ76_320002978 [Vairimorpha ceranae]KKO75096.1 hypothetical protein AAJ76_320002978 [Vairimorpha ceranae]
MFYPLMLFLFQIIFCSKPKQILDHNVPLDLRINISSTSRAYENKDFCENVDIQQKSQESTKTVDKYSEVNQSDVNLLTYFTGKDLNSRCKNVDYDLCNFSSLLTKENNLMPRNFTRSTVIKYVSKKRYCTSKQSISDKTCLEASNISGNDTSEHSYIITSWNEDTDLLLDKNQNDLIQEQYGTSENNAFLQKNNNVLVLSKNQNYCIENNSVNEPSAVQTDSPFNVDILSTINNPESSYSFNNAYKNDNSVKDKRKKLKTNNVSNIQTNGNEKALKSKRKIKTYKTIRKNQFTASERELFKKYKESEDEFRRFLKLKIKNQILQFIKKLEISNLCDDLKQNSIFALRSLLSFLDTISAIYINTKKKKNKKEFLNSLNPACNQFSKYADVSQKLLIFKLICNNLHEVNDGGFCCISDCDFYEIYHLLFSVDIRFNSLYKRLAKLRDNFK